MRELSQIAARLAAYRPGTQQAPQRAAVALLLRPHPDEGCELLLIKRAEHEDDPWSGHMALPGGRVDPEDPTPLQAAQRETLEEVALDLTQHGRLLGQLDDLPAVGRGRLLPLVITPFVFALEYGEVRPNEEVQEVHWVSPRRLLDPAVRSTMRYDYEGQRYDLPCLRLVLEGQERVVWGLTYRMLVGLFDVLGWQP